MLSSVVIFAAVLLCWPQSFLMFVRLYQLTLGFIPIFLFAEDVLPYLVFTVITVDNVAHKTLNSSAVLLQMLPPTKHNDLLSFEV